MLAPTPGAGRRLKSGGLVSQLEDIGPLVVDVDLRGLPAQVLPRSAAAFAQTVKPVGGGPQPSGILVFDGDTGNANGEIVDLVDGTNMLQVTGGAPLSGEDAVGMVNPATGRWHPCYTFTDGGDGELDSTHQDAFELKSTGSCAWVFVFRMMRPGAGSTRVIAQKWNGTRGWRLEVSAANQLVFACSDGSTTISAIQLMEHDEGWHYAFVLFNRTANILRMHTEFSGAGSTGVPSSMAGNPEHTTPMQIGSAATPPMQLAYAAVLYGAAAEDLDTNRVAYGTAFWKYGSPPAQMTYARTSAPIAAMVSFAGNGAEEVACFGTGQCPRAYSPAWGERMLLTFSPQTNIITSSYPDTWTAKAGGSASVSTTRAPSGSFAPSVVNGNGVFTTFAATNGVTYTLSLWLWATTPHTARLQHTNSAGTVENAGLNVAVTTVPKRFSFTFTAGSTATLGVAIDPDTVASQPVFAWGAMLHVGPTPQPLRITSGTTGGYTAANPCALAVNQTIPQVGAIDVEFALLNDNPVTGAERFVVDCRGASDANRHAITVSSAEAGQGKVWDNAGAALATAASPAGTVKASTRCHLRLQWQTTGPLPLEASARTELRDIQNGTEHDGRVTDYTGAAVSAEVDIGRSATTLTNHLEGVIRRLRVIAAVA